MEYRREEFEDKIKKVVESLKDQDQALQHEKFMGELLDEYDQVSSGVKTEEFAAKIEEHIDDLLGQAREQQSVNPKSNWMDTVHVMRWVRDFVSFVEKKNRMDSFLKS